MAKKEAAREPSQKRGTESDLQREVTAILTAAGWKVIKQREGRRRFAGDILASRTELGRERRYAIECVQEINGPKVQDYFSRFRNWVRQSKEPFTDFDEFWLVGYEYAHELTWKKPDNPGHFRALDLNELRALLAPAHPGTKSKARTKIGRAVETNEKEINLAVAGSFSRSMPRSKRCGASGPIQTKPLPSATRTSPNTSGCALRSNTFR
jgi:hypothetical protein